MRVDDRETPLVEGDQLGEKLGAGAVALAVDGVDKEFLVHSLRSLMGSGPVCFRARGVLGYRQERPRGRRGAAAALVTVGLRRERDQGGTHEPGRAVRVVAGTAAHHEPRPPLQVGAGLRPGPAPRQLGERGGDPWQAVEAGAALAGGLERQVADDVRRLHPVSYTHLTLPTN